MSISRRALLRAGAGVVVAGAAPRFILARSSGAVPSRPRSLVVVELNGGNDALNTIVPVSESAYYEQRPTLAIRPDQALMLERGVGMHPAMVGMHRLYREGKLAIFQGVGYPDPSRSHFRSMEIWHRGNLSAEVKTGWLGRCRAQLARSGRSLPAFYVGEECPEVFASAGAVDKAIALDDSADGKGDSFASGLGRIGEEIHRSGRPGLYHIALGNFDTHARQAEVHADLLGVLSDSLSAFLADVERSRQDVMVLIFSEFGRRLRENSSAGTDHGSAGVMFLAGAKVAGGMHGRMPDLTDLVDGEMRHRLDFRDVYAAVARDWLGVQTEQGTASLIG